MQARITTCLLYSVTHWASCAPWESVGSVNINWWEAAGDGGTHDDLAAHLLSVKCHSLKILDGKLIIIFRLSDLLALTLHQRLESSFYSRLFFEM